jgi:hypothetical protein
MDRLRYRPQRPERRTGYDSTAVTFDDMLL